MTGRAIPAALWLNTQFRSRIAHLMILGQLVRLAAEVADKVERTAEKHDRRRRSEQPAGAALPFKANLPREV